MATPILDLLQLDSHSKELIIIADISDYPEGFSIGSPTVEITPPSFEPISIPFVANSIQIYNSTTLGITTADCQIVSLPDGIYKITYSIFPAYKYYVKKTFLRIERLLEKFDNVYVKLDILQCDLATKTQEKKQIDLIWEYINGAIASANHCAEKQAMELYARANSARDNLSKKCSCNG
jgi:hypothetical protein